MSYVQVGAKGIRICVARFCAKKFVSLIKYKWVKKCAKRDFSRPCGWILDFPFCTARCSPSARRCKRNPELRGWKLFYLHPRGGNSADSQLSG